MSSNLTFDLPWSRLTVLACRLRELRVTQMHIVFVCLWVFQWLQNYEVEVKTLNTLLFNLGDREVQVTKKDTSHDKQIRGLEFFRSRSPQRSETGSCSNNTLNLSRQTGDKISFKQSNTIRACEIPPWLCLMTIEACFCHGIKNHKAKK